MRNDQVLKIVLSAMFIALTWVATYIGVPWPFAAGGYMHLGTLVALTIAIAFGKEYGALAGGVGMALFDVLSPWVVWAPGTLVVRFIMGYVVGLIAYDNKTEQQGMNVFRNLFAIIGGAFVMIPGYYLYEAIFLTDFNAALASIPGNIIQFTLGMFALLLVPAVIYVKKQTLDSDLKG